MRRWTQQDLDGLAAGKPPGRVPKVRLERDVSREGRRWLKRHPAVQMVWRVNSGAHMRGKRFIRYHTIPGMSDVWVLLKPHFGTVMVFIEWKRPGKEARTEQAAFLESMRERGHIAFVATSESAAWEQLSEALRARKGGWRHA
jgi:hypothetical protein